MPDASEPRIAYLALMIGLTRGIIATMDRYQDVAWEHGILIDYHWLTSNQYKPRFINKILIPEGNYFQVRWRQVKLINQMTERYNVVVLRYPLFDPVLFLFLKRKHKIVLEHHSKELEELKELGDFRYWPERLFGWWGRSFAGHTAVTQELVDYERERVGFDGPMLYSQNAIKIGDAPQGNIGVNPVIQLVMVSSAYYPWHGLELVLNNIAQHPELSPRYQLHLVGKLNEQQQSLADSLPSVVSHGFMDKDQLAKIYTTVDAGLDVFNMQCKGMNETSSLKVREYFANGLLVVTGTNDTAFPADLEYYQKVGEFELPAVLEFVHSHSGVDKNKIFASTREYIDCRNKLSKLYNWCVELSKGAHY